MTTTPAKTDAASTPTRASVAEIMDWRPLMESYAVSEGIPMPGSLEVSPEDIQRYSELYDGFSASRIGDDYDYVHSVRFRATAALFGGYLERSRKIVELGGHSRIGVFAQTVFQSDYQAYESELRDRFNLPNGAFDCVLCLEVIEHIKDTAVSETTIERIASFNYSGVMNVLSEAFRVLRPGGVLLITTPNAASVDVIFKVMQGEHPHLFEPHVRELAPKQVKAFAERVGFHLEAFGTFFAWGTAEEDTRSRILEFISQMGFDPSNRGDDAVYVLRKPLAVSNGSTARETAAYWRAAHHKGEVPDYEEFLSNAFAKFIEPGNVIVDIGVNYGRHFKSFQTLTGEGGRVIGFEPVPAFVEHSKMICGADAEIRQKALSDKPGAGEFLFMTKAVGESGFKERASQGDRGAVPISVEISTLDEELQGLDRLNYIKIDTEGHELSILRGAEAVIARCRPIVSVEWGQPTYTLYGHSKGDLFDWADGHDYAISDLFGNLVVDRDEWYLVSDRSYWDFFLVPKEKSDQWRVRFA